MSCVAWVRRHIALVIGVTAFAYYALLSAKTWTWLFSSSDSGDWLAVARIWFVPQPEGSPLYVGLCKLLGMLPGSLVIWLTLVLSVLPAAVTVAVVYLIVRKLTERESIALVCSLVLLGASTFLTMSTVLEEQSLAIMFVVVGYWAYLNKAYKRAAMLLGFATAVNIVVLGAVLLWIAIDLRTLLKTAPIYIVCGVLPYIYVPILMMQNLPPLIAGHWSLANLKTYMTIVAPGGIVGSISMVELPERVLSLASLIVASLGLALVPLCYSLRKRPWSKVKLVAVTVPFWYIWFYSFCIDPITWRFLAYAMPFLAILAGLGLAALSKAHLRVVAIGALALIVVNAFFLNANTLTNAAPLATTYEQELKALPNGAVVVTTAGEYSLGIFYVMSQGKKLIPIIYPYLDDLHYTDYGAYLETFGLQGDSTTAVVAEALAERRPVYFCGPVYALSNVTRAFEVTPADYEDPVYPIVGLTGLAPERQ